MKYRIYNIELNSGAAAREVENWLQWTDADQGAVDANAKYGFHNDAEFRHVYLLDRLNEGKDLADPNYISDMEYEWVCSCPRCVVR